MSKYPVTMLRRWAKADARVWNNRRGLSRLALGTLAWFEREAALAWDHAALAVLWPVMAPTIKGGGSK